MNKNLFFMLSCVFFTLSSCENRDSLEVGSLITAVGELTRSSSLVENDPVANNAVVFTGNDIQWFNPQTREIRFKKNVDHTTFQTYQKIHFNLNGSPLFTAQTYASQYHNFAVNDLVLFIDLFTQKCYLHDCYPLDILGNDPETKKNKEARADTWNSFIKQLEAEKKIK